MNQRMFASRRSISRDIRALFSDPSHEAVRDYSAQLIHRVCPNCRVVAAVVPATIREGDLLETAAKYRFDIAILVLNNIFYAPYDLNTHVSTLAADGVSLVRRIRAFNIPIIALYGHPHDPWHVTTLLRAGAMAAMQLPFKSEEMEYAIQISLLGNH
jgi:DNA-binding NarL/FixJ family response regulator